MVEPGNCENEITAVQDQDQSLEAHNRRSPDVVLQSTTGNMRYSLSILKGKWQYIFLFSHLKEILRLYIILFYLFSYLAYFYKYFG